MPPVWSRCTACELLLLFAIPAIHFIWLGISSQGQPGFQHPWKEVREIVQPHSQQSQLNKSLAQAANTANTLMFGIPSQLVWRVPPVKRVPTPHIPLVLWPESGMPNFCCYDGIRCQVFEYIQEYTEYTIFVSSHIPLLYSPMVGTIVDGLRGRAKTCGYKVVEVYERQSKEVDGDGLYKVSHEVKESRKPTEPTAGDVWIHVGKGLQWEFYRDCQNSFAAQRVYCILYQSDPVDVEAGPGICEIWEYSAADIPKAPVVRYVPPGYRPLWQGRNDQELSTFNTSRMEWVFLGYLGKVQRLECWNHLRSMPELQHVIFTNYSNVWRKSDWQELARRPNVLFLNMHGNCNSTRIRDGLETASGLVNQLLYFVKLWKVGLIFIFTTQLRITKNRTLIGTTILASRFVRISFERIFKS